MLYSYYQIFNIGGFIKRINIEKGRLLRSLGWSYEDIAEELNCSYVWCAKYLKDVRKDKEKMKRSYITYISEPYVFEVETLFEQKEKEFFGD